MPKKRGGRKRLIETNPQLYTNFKKVLEDHTAGDPMKPNALWTCQGVIFESVQQVQHYMAKAETRTGLTVAVNILNKVYQAGRKVTQGFKKTMRIVFDNLLPRLNYRVMPAIPAVP